MDTHRPCGLVSDTYAFLAAQFLDQPCNPPQAQEDPSLTCGVRSRGLGLRLGILLAAKNPRLGAGSVGGASPPGLDLQPGSHPWGGAGWLGPKLGWCRSSRPRGGAVACDSAPIPEVLAAGRGAGRRGCKQHTCGSRDEVRIQGERGPGVVRGS
uniref:Uncharacterized protein n=1 Tax=Rangifer tarandus platyrhynchus TaxID=3082113 RepID=A0ACB0F8V9_RANTA|nr:unnamed protein product [Rangifer tarandus platyrhynchus]